MFFRWASQVALVAKYPPANARVTIDKWHPGKYQANLRYQINVEFLNGR